MQIGMIGVGRMGGNMVRRLLRAGHQCVVFDVAESAITTLEAAGATGARTLTDFVAALDVPRAVWLMLPAALVDPELDALAPLLVADDIVIDGGNSHYHDDLRRARQLAAAGIHYVDVGTSGGTWGLDRGYCLMIGGATGAVQRLDPLFATLAPGRGSIPPTPGRGENATTAERGYLHCGPAGAGHFVKMVHNGIEYGVMAAYAEGLSVLRHADRGLGPAVADADTTPLRHPDHYRYTFDVGEVAELWRRGSVITSWMLDLSAKALLDSPDLSEFTGHVADSGEGRWAIQAAIDEAVPVPVLSAALWSRFASRGDADFASQLLSALRFQFGGHLEAKGEDVS